MRGNCSRNHITPDYIGYVYVDELGNLIRPDYISTEVS